MNGTKKISGTRIGFAAATMLAVAVPAFGQTVTEFAPSTNTATGVWFESNITAAGVATIVNLTGVGGNLETNQPLPIGATRLTTTADNGDRANVGVLEDYGQPQNILSSLSLVYSSFKATNGTQNLSAAPALKLSIFNGVCDDAVSAGDCFGVLVFEPTWNQPGFEGSSVNPPLDTWQTWNIDQNTGLFWWTGGFGQPNTAGGPPLRTLAQWLAVFSSDFLDSTIFLVEIGVGSFNQNQLGYFDNVQISHTFGGGFSAAYDFEPPTNIRNLDTGEFFGTIQEAIDDVDTLDGHTLEVQVATHFEGDVHVTKDLTITGGSVGTIKMTEDTGNSGDDRAWFLVDAGVVLNVENLIFDGNGHLVFQAFRHKGSGSFTNCGFTDIKFNESGPDYSGLAVAAFGDGPVDFTGCTFDEIGRIGVLYFGAGIAGSSYSNNVYTGKGDGDFLDYGVELGAGAVVTISNSTITGNRGVASVDGSTSAGILATTFFGAGTAGTVTNTVLTANSAGIANGFGASDTTVLTANFNSIFANTTSGIFSVSTVVVDAENNWWGDASGPADPVGVFEADNPPCFDPDTDTLADVSNFDGAGNAVSDGNVDYCPWLLSPGTLSLIPDSSCYGAGVGDTVTITVRMSAVKDFVVGGQFFMDYDNSVLDFISAVPGAAPFTVEIFESVDEGTGTIDYAVGVVGGGPGTAVDTDMAVLTFTALTETCGTAGLVGFRAHVPPTRLTNEHAEEIAVLTSDLGSVSIDGTPPVITPPSDIVVNADAGGCDAAVTVPALVATDGCSGIDTVVNDFNFTADASDVYPPGTTTVTWTVTDLCGNVSTDSQDVTVLSVNDMTVAVELAGVSEPTVTRCITFELWSCPDTIPVEIVSIDLTFTAGLFVGNVEIPCGFYDCITARDGLHTLRRTDDDGDFGIVGTGYVADFTVTGTTDDSLVGGNLNDDFVIDILDFGEFVGQFGDVTAGDTPCATLGPDADISGNGIVFSEDFTFISVNFLETREANCCGAPFALVRTPGGRSIQAASVPVTRISLAQLRKRGLGHLAIADLNGDGWLDVADMEAFVAGDRP